MADCFFIAGTDTGVGKSVISVLLMQFLYAKGYHPFYLKPFQTGCKNPCDADSDARFVYEHVSALRGKHPGNSTVYCFKNPKAPYFAARNEGKKSDPDIVSKAIDQKCRTHTHVIIEGAGGLLVPVTEKMLMVDLIKMTNAKPILVARAGLGTINHTLLSLEAMTNRDIRPETVVLVEVGAPPASQELIRENIEAIERFSGIDVAGVIGKISDFSNPAKAYQEVLERILGLDQK